MHSTITWENAKVLEKCYLRFDINNSMTPLHQLQSNMFPKNSNTINRYFT